MWEGRDVGLCSREVEERDPRGWGWISNSTVVYKYICCFTTCVHFYYYLYAERAIHAGSRNVKRALWA